MTTESLEAIVEQGSFETSAVHDRRIRFEEVACAYAVFLGRTEDEPELSVDWVGRPLADMLARFMASDEFINIQNHLIKDASLLGRHSMSASVLAEADRWLAGLVPDHRPSPGVEWADLLLAAVTAHDLAGLADPPFDRDALRALTQSVQARRDAGQALNEVVSFDGQAFLADRAHRRYRDADGGVNFGARIDRRTPAPVLLPFFTEGLDQLSRPAPLTLGVWLGKTQHAALDGSLTHWLWEEGTYRHNRSLKDGDLDDVSRESRAYLDFLLAGDQAGVSPHPLFCHQAYRALNEAGSGAGFHDFVRRGEAAGIRTSAVFDPEFYLWRQPQARDQVAAGRFGSALEHCVRVGLAAGWAFSPDFDRQFYLDHNPDVAQGVAEGHLPSAEWHYVFHGGREGRAPNPYFDPRYYADRYPFAEPEMRRLGIATLLEHFLLVGRERGWRANRPLLERAVPLDDAKALFERRGRRAYGEIVDGAIAVPAADAPRLSIIVPVSNQADFTAGLVKSAAFALETLKARRGIETEIIVVDNGSRDHTETILAALPAVRVARFDGQIGFPVAVNAGAAIARGDVLLVVNNDIEFQPDALDRIFAVLDDDPSVGVVGAKIILPDETLQEVGASMDRLGNPEGFGRGTDAYRVRGDRRVTVDYASGCFIAFRRADFEALSGFEEAFSPGYYEDADFALRMKRDLNKVTVVDTGLAVTHYEHASFAKGRPIAVNSSGILRNRVRLKTAHAALFQAMDARSPAQRAERAREALGDRIRILVVLGRMPSAGLGSGSTRQATMLDLLEQWGLAFDIVALEPAARADRYKDPRVRVFRAWMPGESLETVLRDHGGDYSHLWIGRAHDLRRVAGVVSDIKTRFGLTVVCDTEDLLSQQRIEQMRADGRPGDDDLALTLAADELFDLNAVDLWVASNGHDHALLRRLGLGPVIEIGHAAETTARSDHDRPFADRDRILLIEGDCEAADADGDGLPWALEEVWPHLPALEGSRLTLVGPLSDRLNEAAVDRFGGDVEILDGIGDAEMVEIYDQSRLVVVPCRFTAEAAGRVVEAALAGVPVVMTAFLAHRLGVAEHPDLAVADEGASFAAWIERLYTDDSIWRSQIELQGREMGSRFGRDAFAEQFGRALDQVGCRVTGPVVEPRSAQVTPSAD